MQQTNKRRWLASALLILGISIFFLFRAPAFATTGTPALISFEGKIVKSDGTNIADGTYNMEFKIYSGTSNVGNGDTLLFTEDWLVGSTQGGVAFTSGTYAKNIGSAGVGTGDSVALSSLNFNQYPLWISVQIGNTSSCTITTTFQSNCGGDGEMTPYIQLTSAPYAMNAGQLGGIAATGFVQLSPGSQQTGTISVSGGITSGTSTFNSTNLNFGAAGTVQSASGSSMTVQSQGTGQLILNSAGGSGLALQVAGTTNALLSSGALAFQQATTENVASAATGTQLTIQGGAATSGTNVGGNLLLQGGSGASTGASGSVIVKSNTNNSTTAFQVQNASATSVLTVDTSDGRVGINTASPPTADLTFGSGASRTINVAQASSGVGNNLTVQAGQGSGANAGGNLLLQAGAQGTSGGTGSVIVKANGTDSSTAFQVQNSSGVTLLSADTLENTVTLTGNTVVNSSGAFPTTSVLDNFNRANGALGSNWTGPSDGNSFSMVINSNAATSGGAGFGDSSWSTPIAGPNIEEYATINSLPAANDTVGVSMLSSPTASLPTGYTIVVTNTSPTTTWNINRIDASGSHPTLATTTHAVSAGDSMGLSRIGNQLIAWYKPAAGSWTQILTATDSSYNTAGYYVGLWSQDTTAQLDNFGGGTGTLGIGLTVNGNQLIQSSVNTTTAFQVQNASGTTVLNVDTTTNTLTVKSVVINGTLTINGHIITGGSTPTIAAGAGAGTGPSVSISGNDTSGTITITTGTSPSAGLLATITFGSAYGAAPKVTLEPDSLSAALLQHYAGSTTTTFTLSTANGPSASTTYSYFYHAEQ